MTAVAEQPDPLIGRVVAGKYLIVSRVGSGAMGTVYEARQTALDTRVAIKVLNREIESSSHFAQRFRVEAKAASALDHVNSTRVLDFGSDGSLLYICMEFLQGQTLAELLASEGELAPVRIADLLGQVLAALAKAHDRGILHRDIKPENVMVLPRTDDDGREYDLVKVCDFGIAKLDGVERLQPSSDSSLVVGAGPSLTHAGTLMGTPDYMSPEQASGSELDARSDIYATGALLYFLLTGRAPFADESLIAVLAKHISDEPEAPSAFADVDPELEAICRKALRKKPEDRYQTAREMRQALRQTSLFTQPRAHATGPVSREWTNPGLAPTLPEIPRPSEDVAPAPAPAPLPEASLPVAAPRSRAPMVVAGVVALLVLSALLVMRAERATAPVAAQGESDAAIELVTVPRTLAPTLASGTDPAASSSAPTSGSASGGTSPVPVASVANVASARTSAVASAGTGRGAHLAPSASATEPDVTAASAEADPSASAREVAAPEPPPVVMPPPVASSAALPPPSAPPTAVAPPPPAFHPENGRASVTHVESDRVPVRAITSLLRHVDLQRCYVDALTRAGASHAGSATLVIEIDQNLVTRATLRDGLGLPGLARCIEAQLTNARVSDADTGDATATVSIDFVSP